MILHYTHLDYITNGAMDLNEATVSLLCAKVMLASHCDKAAFVSYLILRAVMLGG